MRTNTFFRITATLALIVWPAFGANILVNGGFETGDFTGFGGSTIGTSVSCDLFAIEGGCYAHLGYSGTLNVGPAVTVPGASYTLSFWLASWGVDPVIWGSDASDFAISWNSAEVLRLQNPDSGGVWTHYSFPQTGTGGEFIQITFWNTPPGSWIALDGLSLDDAAASPEPATLALFAGGLIALAIRRRLGRRPD